MFKGKNKYIIIAVIVILLIAVFVALKLVPKVTQEEGVAQGAGGDTTNYQETWEDALYKKLEKKFNKKYPDDYKFELSEDNKLEMTLGELEAHGIKLSEFNTDTIHCDFTKSHVTITYDTEYKSYSRSYYLECTNDEEAEPTEVEE